MASAHLLCLSRRNMGGLFSLFSRRKAREETCYFYESGGWWWWWGGEWWHYTQARCRATGVNARTDMLLCHACASHIDISQLTCVETLRVPHACRRCGTSGGRSWRRVGCPRRTLTRRPTSSSCGRAAVHRRGKSGKRKVTFCLTYLLTFFLTVFLTYLVTVFLTYLLSFCLTLFLAYLVTFFLTFLLTFFRTFFLTFLLTFLLIFFLTYLLTFFLTYLLTFLLIFFLTYLLTFFLTYLLTYLVAFLMSFFWHSFWHIFWHSVILSGILPDILSDILSDISSDILSDISCFWHIFWQSFWHILWQPFYICSDISSDILSDILSDRSSDILSDILSDMPSDICSAILSGNIYPFRALFDEREVAGCPAPGRQPRWGQEGIHPLCRVWRRGRSWGTHQYGSGRMPEQHSGLLHQHGREGRQGGQVDLAAAICLSRRMSAWHEIRGYPQPQQNISWAAVGTNACLAQVGAKKRGGADRMSLTDFKTCCILNVNMYVCKGILFFKQTGTCQVTRHVCRY